MRKITEKIKLQDGSSKRRQKDTRHLLNLNYLSLTNSTYTSGEYDFPVIYSKTELIPDYLALYNQPGSYHQTALTGVCFYTYDPVFDGLYGLFNAIYYDNKELLEFYKERFNGVRFIISPDYSQFGDLQKVENLIRLWKARIVTLWFILELKAVAIPSITYISEDSFPLFFSGLEGCEVVAFSTKGHIRYANERALLKAAVKYAVDNLPLKTIIVYSVCGNDDTSLKLFKYAIDHGVHVVIPDNSLRERNRRRCTVS
ncbi:MAG: DUF4417 domain-containing protein [Clostridia bacterium]|nr:DUF4417 domain-containing protein [Clostridia bacterium]